MAAVSVLVLLAFVVTPIKGTVVSMVFPRIGSVNGGSRITIIGTGFSDDQFNFGPGREHLGNVVKLVSATKSYDCDKHMDGSTRIQVTCYTRPMEEDFYTIQVTVDGVPLDKSAYCPDNPTLCVFRSSIDNTPTITALSRLSGPPGQLITAYGRIMTRMYEANDLSRNATNGVVQKIERVYMGGMPCNMIKPDGSLYELSLDAPDSKYGNMTCLITSRFIGAMRFTFLIEDYGRSKPDLKLLKLFPGNMIAMYEQYPEITAVSPTEGSTEGYTFLTITGAGLDDATVHKPIFKVGGVDCVDMLNVSDTSAVCLTPKQVTGSHFFGNRGLMLHTWASSATDTALDDIPAKSTSDSSYNEQYLEDGDFVVPVATVGYLDGYLSPTTNASYQLKLSGAAGSLCRVKFSNTLDPADGTVIIEGCNAVSDVLNLVERQPYYIQVLFSTENNAGTSDLTFQLSLFSHTAAYNSPAHFGAQNEIQQIALSSDITEEIQVVDLANWPAPVDGVNEVQQITVTSYDTSLHFRLKLHGVATALLSVTISDVDLQKAINALPCIPADAPVTVVKSDSTYTVTFSGMLGDWSEFTPVDVDQGVTVDVVEMTAGQSSYQKVIFQEDEFISPPVSADASVTEVADSINELFSVTCPDLRSYSALYNDYEDGKPAWLPSQAGNIVDISDPFCGKSAFRNPTALYLSNTWDRSKWVKFSTTSNRWFCFAYKGIFDNRMNLHYTRYFTLNGAVTTRTYYIDTHQFNFTNDGDRWHYNCLNLLELLQTRHSDAASVFRVRSIVIYRHPLTTDDVYVDEFMITANAPPNYQDLPNQRGVPHIRARTLSVTKNLTKISITMDPWECRSVSPISIRDAAPGAVTVDDISHSSPPVTGMVKLTRNGKDFEFPANATASLVASILEATDVSLGKLKVERYDTCHGFKYKIEWLTAPGKQEVFVLNTSALDGPNVDGQITEVSPGGVWHTPIPGHMLLTHHTEPQVTVVVNNLPAACNATFCSYTWSSNLMPSVTDIEPTTGTLGTVLNVTGSGFDDIVIENNVVKLGSNPAPCTVSAATASWFTCTLGNGDSGTYTTVVSVRGKGAAQISPAIDFTYSTSVTSFTPTTSGLGGGLNLTLTGSGLGKSTLNVEVDGRVCLVIYSNMSTIICQIPAATAEGSVDVVIKDDDTVISTLGTQFTYTINLTPTVSEITPTTGSPKGGELLTLKGSQFGSDPVPIAYIRNTLDNFTVKAKVKTWHDQEITISLPGLTHGTHDVTVNIPGKGTIRDSNGLVPQITSTFEVTALSPTETSAFGGRLFTITGAGFTNDVDITVGTTECIKMEVTDAEITCQLERVSSTHLITNLGEDLGYNWDKPSIVIDVGDTVRWVWRTEVTTPPLYNIVQVTSLLDDEPVANGFNSGDRTAEGIFEHEFVHEGTFYYSSGQVLSVRPSVTPRGQVTVQAKPASVGKFKVAVNEVEAKYSLSSARRRRSTGTCDSSYNSLCTVSVTADASQPQVVLNPCLTRTVSSITPNEGTADTMITITGAGFGTDVSCIAVYAGDKPLTIEALTDTEMAVMVNATDPPALYTSLPINVELLGKGYAAYALTEAERSFIYKPHLTSIQPQTGSIGGSTVLTISGGGFVDDVSVMVDGLDCPVVQFTTTEIICSTPDRAMEVTDASVGVTVQGFPTVPCADARSCLFSYLDSVTPQVISVSPTSVPNPDTSALTTLTITGANFALDPQLITVEIGSVPCTVLETDLSSTNIQCTVSNLPVGTTLNKVLVNVAPYGINKDTDNVVLTGVSLISSMTPSVGSVKGGTSVTIMGNGFFTDTAVTIDGVTCVVSNVSLSQVVCTSPPHDAGTVDVIVTSLGQTYTAVSYTYSDGATPTIESVSPTSSYQSGTDITITGTMFSTTPEENDIKIGGVPCIPTLANDTEIVCTIGSNAAGKYTVDVNVFAKGVAQHPTAGDVLFTYDIVITAISPTEGSYGGGQLVTVTGDGLSDDTSVTVCSMLCTRESSTLTQFVCTTPSHPGSGDTACDVMATSGSVSTPALSGAFTYRDSLTPFVSSINPTRGGTGGGTLVTVTGNNFGTDATQILASVDDVPCAVISVVDTQVVCKTGAHSGNVKAPVSIKKLGQGNAIYNATTFYYIDVWSSKYTWGGIQTPEEGDFIVVPAGMTLLLDVTTPVIKMLLIQGGKLMFEDKGSTRITLNAENILITDGGVLEIGTEDEPYLGEAEIVLHGQLRAKELPIFGAKTLAVRNGSLELHGRPIPSTWTVLAETAEIGATQITLQVEPINWRVGDYIAIASTGDHMSQNENEKVRITAIDGATLTIDPPLKFRHLGITETYTSPRRVTKLELRAEVGLLTRNILIRGSSNKDWEGTIAACDKRFDPGEFATQTCFQGRFGEEAGSDQFGAAIMFHQPVHNSYEVHSHMEYVEITYAGQAFRLGRYPIHFHRNGDMKGSYVRGCAIHWGFNRAINIHDTHYVLIEHNVVYDIMGGALFLEDSIEHDTVFQYNLVMFVKASSSLLNDDITPAGFWVTHPANIVRHNHVAGGTHFGFWYRMHEHPIGPSYDPNLCPRKVPLGEFYNNTVHSVGWYGLWVFEFYDPMEVTAVPECKRNIPKPAQFRNLTTWNSLRGAEWVECGAIQFIGFVVANNYKAGMEMYFIHDEVPRYSPLGSMIKDAVVIGQLNYAEHPVCTWRGLVMPFDNGLTVDGVEFFNFPTGGQHHDQPCAALGTVKVICICSYICAGYEYQFRNVYWDTTATSKANYEWQNQAEFDDLDGTLTGAGPDSRALAKSAVLPSTCQEDPDWSINKPGVICPGSSSPDVVRFTFNKPEPVSLKFKTVTFTAFDSDGELTDQSVTVPWRTKSSTHPEGWLVLLPVNRTYQMVFDGMERVTNLSYVGTYWGMKDYTWLRISHAHLFNEPFDKVQVLQSVPPTSTSILDRLPVYGDPSGAVQVTQTANDVSLTYLVTGQNKGTYGDDPISFSAIKCFFVGCVDPGGQENDVADGRPLDYRVWSDTKTWNYIDGVWEAQQLATGTAATIPPNDQSLEVFIPRGTWLVVDAVALIEVKCLTIEGTLEFEYLPQDDGSYLSHTLKADYIIIRGGNLLAGYGDKIYQGQLKIILTGSLQTPTRSLDEGPNIGAKAMGVYGALELHGKPHDVIWTRLKTTAEQGSNKLYLSESVDWSVGDEIVVATTGFSPWETETHIIESVGGNPRDEITIVEPLKYTHLAESDTLQSYPEISYHIRAEVGLLSRNIKIMGAEDSTLDSQAYGARVLVGRELDTRDELDMRTNIGYANLSGVEFSRTGQDGFIDPLDPRFSLAFSQLGDVEKSRITNCSFVRGFSPTVGAFGSNNVTVQNNVFYHAVGQAIKDMGKGNKWLDNLITLTLWPGTFRGRYEIDSEFYEAAIEVNFATDPIIQGNVVAGAERAGYRIDGERCFDETTPEEDRWRDNTAHSVMLGVYMMYDDDDCFVSDQCSLVSNFVIYKAFYMGFYSQVECSIHLRNVSFYDNMLSIISIIIQPSAEEHEHANKLVQIEGGVFIGQSPSFDCARDKTLDADRKNIVAGQEASPWSYDGIVDMFPRRYGKIGIGWPFFLSKDNMAPETGKLFIFAKEAPAMYGRTIINGTYFGHFGKTCDDQYDLVISTNPENPDVEQKIEMSNVKVDSTVDVNSLVLMQPPNARYASSDECVDMDCDSKKICFIVDRDGGFLGSPGTIIPNAAYAWNGVKVHGIGDYRIPNVLMSNMDGSKRNISDVYDEYGITGFKSCQWNAYWNAYKCGSNLEYERLLVENMDEDFLTRRLSPVALVCSYDGKKYLDLYSGPRSVGICFGYACTERIGTYFMLTPLRTDCELYFSGTAPQHIRLHFGGRSDQWLVFSMYMGEQFRYDVFFNNSQVLPRNFDAENNKYLRPPASYPTYYYPTATGQPGDNYFDVNTKMLTVLIKGPGILDVEMTPQIIMSTTLEVMSIDEFFASDKIIANLANFLEIAPENILIMNVVSEDSRRRRRATGITCTFMIGNPVVPSASVTYISTDSLISLANKLILEGQTGSMSNVLGTQVGDFMISRPAPPVSDAEAWQQYMGDVDSGKFLQPVYKPNNMRYLMPPSDGLSYEGAPFVDAPRFQIVDEQNRLVSVLVAPDGGDWLVEATLDKSDEFAHKEAYLIGNTTVPVLGGYADFTDLGISHAGYNYKITFTVIHPSDAGSGYTHVMAVPSITKRRMYLETRLSKTTLKEGEPFDMEIYIKDGLTNLTVRDLQWKGEAWTGRVYISDVIDQEAELRGNTEMTFSNYGFYKLSGLSVRGSSRKLAISVIVRTQTASYVIVFTSVVDLVTDDAKPVAAYNKPVQIKFAEAFDTVAASKDLFLAGVYNWMKRATNDVEFCDMDAFEGSINVDLRISGDEEDVNAALQRIAELAKDKSSMRFGDTTLHLSPYMKVDGEYYENLDGQDGLPKSAIIAASVTAVFLIVLIVVSVLLVIYLKKYKHRRLKEHGESTLELKAHGGSFEHDSPQVVFDNYAHFTQGEKAGYRREAESPTGSSGYESVDNSLTKSGKKGQVRRRSLTSMFSSKKESKMADNLLASLAVPLTSDVSRPASRTSVISRQEIRTMFAPRMSVDEGPEPNKIASVD